MSSLSFFSYLYCSSLYYSNFTWDPKREVCKRRALGKGRIKRTKTKPGEKALNDIPFPALIAHPFLLPSAFYLSSLLSSKLWSKRKEEGKNKKERRKEDMRRAGDKFSGSRILYLFFFSIISETCRGLNKRGGYVRQAAAILFPLLTTYNDLALIPSPQRYYYYFYYYLLTLEQGRSK